MKPELKDISQDQLAPALKTSFASGVRMGCLTSVDGSQLVSLVLDPSGKCQLWQTPINGRNYKSLTLSLPQMHWYERAIWDMFGVHPEGHPRLKHLLLHGEYESDFAPFRNPSLGPYQGSSRQSPFLEVKGEGVYEIPVGPIHAGVIEPGHFRFSCFGENVLNLEIRLGYLHRGIEKRLTEVAWQKARFVAEAAASDTAVANSLAHAIALESIMGMTVSPRAQALRTLALEIERLSMHIIDVGGMAADIGFLGISSSMGRLRGKALGLGQALTGSRFMRGYILPGGVRSFKEDSIAKMLSSRKQLVDEVESVIALFLDNQVAIERMQSVAVISKSLVEDFGMVGVCARASGVNYDTRCHFQQGLFPELKITPVVYDKGDLLSRELVRIGEIRSSLAVIEHILNNLPKGNIVETLPEKLPANEVGVGIVEAFRGELIHLVFTDGEGQIMRYAIKDPSCNNWTAVSIAIRNNLIADFPLCNKSFSLSYSGNDL